LGSNGAEIQPIHTAISGGESDRNAIQRWLGPADRLRGVAHFNLQRGSALTN
jgi:hypothetical protein